MKYGELPSAIVCFKLSKISFNTAKKNLCVFRFVSAVRQQQEYVNNEREKLIKQCCKAIPGKPGTYETNDIFNEKFSEVLNVEIEEPLPVLGLSEEDFDDENCCYPDEKLWWMNGSEIETVLSFCRKQERE